jgi:hypothetical protein
VPNKGKPVLSLNVHKAPRHQPAALSLPHTRLGDHLFAMQATCSDSRLQKCSYSAELRGNIMLAAKTMPQPTNNSDYMQREPCCIHTK